MNTIQQPTRPGGVYTPPSPTFSSATQRPAVRFLTQAVQPPSNVYVELTDVLRIAVASSQPNEVLTVTYRLLIPGEPVTEGQCQIAVSGNRAINIHDEPLAEGFLLSVSCKAAVANSRGQTFVRIFLTSPALGQGQPSYMLMADYVTTAMAPAHPNGRQLAPVEGPGSIVGVSLGLQPGGVDWTLSVPTNARWRIMSIMAALATAVGGVARQLHPSITTSAGDVFDRFIAGTQAGGTQFFYNFTALALEATTTVGAQSTVITPLPEALFLPSGSFLRPQTANLLAGDQWFLVNAQVEEWLDNI